MRSELKIFPLKVVIPLRCLLPIRGKTIHSNSDPRKLAIIFYSSLSLTQIQVYQFCVFKMSSKNLLLPITIKTLSQPFSSLPFFHGLQTTSSLRLPTPTLFCRSLAPAARDSTWREEQCQQVMRQPLSFLGLPIYFKFKILFYTFTKTLDQRFDIFSSPSFRFIISTNHCCSSKSSCFSDSLRISLIIYYLPPLMCPIVNLWLHCNPCYIPQFTTYLPK